MSSPNTAQFQLSKDQGHEQDVQTKVSLTGAASESTQLTVHQLIAELTPPASGVHTFVLPPLDQWKNKFAIFKQVVSAPGGEAKVTVKETASDAIGDNLSAAADHAILLNFQGESVIVVKETTT